MTDLTFFGG